MNPNSVAIIALLGFYAAFFLLGSWAGRRSSPGRPDEFLLAGRNLPLIVGVMTMVATWVGGGYLNGTAEAVADPARGLVWAQAPWGYALSLVLGGLFFAGKMRRLGFRTMLDVFHVRYGKKVAAALSIPALTGEVFWSAAILVALGTTFGTILGFDFASSIVLSAAVAIAYTCMGGLRSVAYTDTLQLLCILVGLGIAVPFVTESVGGIFEVSRRYVETFGPSASILPGATAWKGAQPWGWQWSDMGLLLMLGGIPWQVYFQRVLACRDERTAIRFSILAGFGCVLAAAPAVVIGMAGAVADWSAVPGGGPSHPALVLPYALKYLTPPLIAVIGLAAVAAAVMSSVDSSILSASSLFSWNILRPLAGNLAGERFTLATRVSIVGFGVLATLLALSVQSVYTLWFLCGDLVYTILFPQLVAALYFRWSNQWGAVSGALVGLVLRIGGGEPLLGVPAIIPYPMNDPELGVLFPFRTVAMLTSLLAIGLVSWLTAQWNPSRPLEMVSQSTDG
jgi:high affinity choline transporter 7